MKLRGDKKVKAMAAEMQANAHAYREERMEAMAAAPLAGVLAAPPAAPRKSVPNREVFDAKNRATLPGTSVRKEGGKPTGDVAVDEAYDGAGDTFRFYLDVFNRNSIDGLGLKINSSVHLRRKFDNAYWDGNQMAYGDGDGTIFNRFTLSLSVIGHELTHGVVQFSGGLVYQNQAGALNEHLADVFGVLVEQYKKGQEAHQATWLVGEGILAPGIRGQAIRSMRAPGTAYDDPMLGVDPQPYHMRGYISSPDDNGGVHTNSGIPNHCFYLLAQYLGGRAWEKAGAIWYDALQKLHKPQATFADFADKTLESARTLYGAGSMELLFTRRAWNLVGIVV